MTGDSCAEQVSELTVTAKPTMNKQADAIMALPTLALVRALGSSGLPSGYSAKEPRDAKMRSHANIHRPPTIMEMRRPNFWPTYRPPKVENTLTAPRIMEVMYELEIPTASKISVP